ncbi:MAG: hypothetical protein A2W52_04020 [Candidatus Taylorbacteria bacterium RIFCSPHIGHO2_02_49_25]|uniref:Uncharacterized protein n=1 Tax=Candidatus Taylorbacteria bacterium RIFCSPHIGHO2_02_49_25 TaxID=1802305 RepID=A0A1G2ME62_9BACT|nr:MAG: hypothetical protein A2759_02900 [Candidatus Taylorbacteria bacterium RIFCSPHIGHO2_01_FULL_49_60]OHA22157.1 MAG: hypothetical protein A2W52_04020 [Candidatus Taylorbacteria bacterium RIFCSPHIGHO2_02_49_25]OHA36282.1 MAG: hypothetical protein A2W65_03045 [Candidatus Taylorbacteria bacterium RIFCSPLOWO2_02_50_13]OHA37118.1 MAG: hypothetical protein A3B27_00765 [Candidatus Taylorbacteria bacterium RIFCSPLOWO2_01_FULL_50_130]OHA40537.1 MAG: hypothetical protein A3H73_01255 [Candidatus Taylo
MAERVALHPIAEKENLARALALGFAALFALRHAVAAAARMSFNACQRFFPAHVALVSVRGAFALFAIHRGRR